ncbi:MAG: hypothetical protein MJ237_00805 [bacterium]|nr:hypothetical protein [bacterium]
MTFKSKKWFYKDNGKKGGRPKQDPNIYIKLPNINLVTLTPIQYETLLKKYDKELVQTALFVLEQTLLSDCFFSKKYANKNHYALFRSDGRLINYAKRKLNEF